MECHTGGGDRAEEGGGPSSLKIFRSSASLPPSALPPGRLVGCSHKDHASHHATPQSPQSQARSATRTGPRLLQPNPLPQPLLQERAPDPQWLLTSAQLIQTARTATLTACEVHQRRRERLQLPLTRAVRPSRVWSYVLHKNATK